MFRNTFTQHHFKSSDFRWEKVWDVSENSRVEVESPWNILKDWLFLYTSYLETITRPILCTLKRNHFSHKLLLETNLTHLLWNFESTPKPTRCIVKIFFLIFFYSVSLYTQQWHSMSGSHAGHNHQKALVSPPSHNNSNKVGEAR